MVNYEMVKSKRIRNTKNLNPIKFNTLNMAALALALLISSCQGGLEKEADIIYIGGDILTINDTQPNAEAVAVAKVFNFFLVVIVVYYFVIVNLFIADKQSC